MTDTVKFKIGQLIKFISNGEFYTKGVTAGMWGNRGRLVIVEVGMYGCVAGFRETACPTGWIVDYKVIVGKEIIYVPAEYDYMMVVL